MALILRTNLNRRMTAEELDSNFTYLDNKDKRTDILSNCLIKTDFIIVDEPDTELYAVNFSIYPGRLSEIILSDLITAQTINIRGNAELVSIDLNKLENNQTTYIRNNDTLSSVDVSSLINCDLLRISENPLLTSISINQGASFSITNINFRDNALTQESIDEILERVDATGLDSTGLSPSYTLNLGNEDIGTNATPSATGSIFLSSLQSKQWDVTVAT